MFDLLDLERVEILRGPQGTLSGRNSEGGSIKMFTRRPEGSNEGFVEGTYGSRQRIGVRAGFDFALTDNLFGRVSGVYKHQNGYVDQLDFGCVYPAGGPATFVANDGTTQLVNPEGGVPRVRPEGSCRVDRLGEIGYQAIRGALRYNPSEALDVNLTAEYIHDSHSAAGEVLDATAVMDNPNTNVGTNPPQYAGGSLGVPYDNRFMCGRFCNFSSYSSPAMTFFGVATPRAGNRCWRRRTTTRASTTPTTSRRTCMPRSTTCSRSTTSSPTSRGTPRSAWTTIFRRSRCRAATTA